MARICKTIFTRGWWWSPGGEIVGDFNFLFPESVFPEKCKVSTSTFVLWKELISLIEKRTIEDYQTHDLRPFHSPSLSLRAEAEPCGLECCELEPALPAVFLLVSAYLPLPFFQTSMENEFWGRRSKILNANGTQTCLAKCFVKFCSTCLMRKLLQVGGSGGVEPNSLAQLKRRSLLLLS